MEASMVNDDCAFLQRHGDLRRALSKWTARPLFFKRVGALGALSREGSWKLASPRSPPCSASFSCVLSRVDWP
jgi:hypothetical protein